MSEEEWDRGRYEREKRNFIETRRNLRPVYLHVSLIFAATWLAGWGFSWLLLAIGMTNMPARYAICFFLSYLVFIACVRLWADVIRPERGNGWDAGSGDVGGVDGEGCLVLLVVLVLGLVAGAVFAMTGGLSLLLEVAFEVAFAGVVVRRISRKQAVGDWLGALIRNTWLQALAALVVLVSVAAALQAKAPEATTFGAAVKAVLARSRNRQPGAAAPLNFRVSEGNWPRVQIPRLSSAIENVAQPDRRYR
jgi:FtsH-binding integral membrane protein